MSKPDIKLSAGAIHFITVLSERGKNPRYSDKTDHGQNGPEKKRTTFRDKTDHVSGQKDHVPGQNRPGFRTKR